MTSGASRRSLAAGMAAMLFVGLYQAGARLQQITIPGEGGVTYSQYQSGVPTQVSLPGGAVKTMGYDPLLGMTSNRVVDGSGNVVLNRGYQRSRTGTIQAMKTEHGDYAYAYDAIDQVTGVNDPVLADQSFSYDAVGNRVTSGLVPKPGSGNPEQRTYSVNNLNQYLSVTSVSSVVQLSYDLNGNLTQEVANGVVYGFHWDWENRLVGYSNSESGVTASYYYDPFGRRLRKVVNGVTNWYLYADEGLVEEMDGQGHEIRSYGYAPNSLWMNDPVYLRVATGQGTNVYYFLNDQLGAPQKLIARNGEVVWSMESEAFGKATVFSDSTVTNNLRFSSQYYDQESSLHYNTQRYYEPEVGRYLGRDPIEDEAFFRHYGQMKYQRELRRLRAQSLLPTYLFVWNSPMSFSDSRGLSVHSSGCGDCGPMADAINKVNAALNTGKCKQWFENHGYDYSGGTPSFAINCHSRCKLWCLFGGTAWTMPGMDIGFCESKCGSMSAIEIASILIHEIAHHYCTIGPGREDCAISAQDACVNALTGQEMDVPHKLLPVTP